MAKASIHGKIRQCVVLAGVLLPATLGRAAGFEFPDNGTQALGRGGAFTAKADDLTAIQYNVAGLAKLRGTHVLVDANFAGLTYSFARAGVYLDDTSDGVTQPWSGQPYPTVRNSAGFFDNVIPVIAVASDLGLRDLTFALGVYGPSSVGTRKFPDELTLGGGMAPGPQRFDLVDETILVAYPTIAVAWNARPWVPWLYLGAAFQPTVVHIREHVYAMAYLNANLCSSGEAYGCASRAGIDVWDPFAPTAIFSALARPHPRIEVGFSARLPIDVNAAGDGEMTMPSALPGFAITVNNDPGPGATLETKMPLSLRLGGRYFFGPREDEYGDVELDVIYEGWSRVVTFDTTFKTSIGDIDITVPHHYQDTISTRLGGAYNLRLGARRLPLRAGFFWESAAVPPEWTRLDFDAFERFGFTVGAGYTVRGVTLNAALAYAYQPKRTVTNSQVIPIYAVGEAPAGQPGLNGIFESRLLVFSLGAAVSFDALLGRSDGKR